MTQTKNTDSRRVRVAGATLIVAVMAVGYLVRHALEVYDLVRLASRVLDRYEA